MQVQARIGTDEPGIVELLATGKVLADLYRGAERIFERVVKELDPSVPQGASWHRELLDQVKQPLPDFRPPLIQSATASELDNYLKFRHLFGNIYGLELDWERMKPLLDRALPTMAAFTADVEQFITFLRMMSEDIDASASNPPIP